MKIPDKVVIKLLVVIFALNAYVLSLQLSGYASSTLSLCVNSPPVVNASICGSTATAGTLYACTVGLTDLNSGQAHTFSDNTNLFVISSSGIISFTPTSNQVGAHQIIVTATDNSSCTNAQGSGSFNLTISEAAPSQEAPAAGDGVSYMFSLDKTLIEVELEEGQTATETITVTNDGFVNNQITAEIQNLAGIASLSETSFIILPKESKTLMLTILGQREGVYQGRILFSNSIGQKKEVSVIITIMPKQPQFDIQLEVLNKTLYRGDTLRAQVYIIDIAQVPAKAILTYSINSLGNTLATEQEALSIEGNRTLLKDFVTDLNPGSYTLEVELSYDGKRVSAADSFEILIPVIVEAPAAVPVSPIIIFILLIFAAAIIFFIAKETQKKK